MVQAHQMEQPVQHQDADLVLPGMAELLGLFTGPLGGDGHLANLPAGARLGERQDVGWVIFAQELAVQPLQFAIVGDQAAKTPHHRRLPAATARRTGTQTGAREATPRAAVYDFHRTGAGSPGVLSLRIGLRALPRATAGLPPDAGLDGNPALLDAFEGMASVRRSSAPLCSTVGTAGESFAFCPSAATRVQRERELALAY